MTLSDVLNLMAAVLSALAAIIAAIVVFTDAPSALTIATAILAFIGSLCWIGAAIATIIERRRGP